MIATLIGAAVGLIALVGTGVIRRYALQRMLDLPNARSSHLTPTPRGGGIAISAAHILGIVLACEARQVPTRLAISLAVGGLAIVAIGFLDDHRPVPARWRMSIHFAAVAWVFAWIGRLPPIDFGAGPVDLGAMGTILAVVYVVWFINLFNFMDGIDGIAGSQAIAMAASGAGAVLLSGGDSAEALPLVLLSCAVAGFLVWNWPPARIFMGDAGSGYIGFALGCLAVWTVVTERMTVWAWLTLGGVFLTDATTTLLVRAATGASILQAHRSHAYQRLSRYLGSHRSVTLIVCAVNAFWVAPWTAIEQMWPRRGAVCAVISLAPLAALALVLGAGRPGEIGERWARWK